MDGPQIAIFDIGTRAIRLIIGPKIERVNWKHQMFFNASILTNFGEDINERRRVGPQSIGLQKIISFMNDFIPFLRRNDIEIRAFGTAIFRWLENSSDTVSYVQRMTGIEIEILSQKQEFDDKKELLNEAMTILNDREKEILQARRLTDNPKTLEELSQKYKISRERIRQIETKAFEKLQKSMINSSKSKNLLPAN